MAAGCCPSPRPPRCWATPPWSPTACSSALRSCPSPRCADLPMHTSICIPNMYCRTNDRGTLQAFRFEALAAGLVLTMLRHFCICWHCLCAVRPLLLRTGG